MRRPSQERSFWREGAVAWALGHGLLASSRTSLIVSTNASDCFRKCQLAKAIICNRGTGTLRWNRMAQTADGRAVTEGSRTLLTQQTHEQLSGLFRALADPQRIAIFMMV